MVQIKRKLLILQFKSKALIAQFKEEVLLVQYETEITITWTWVAWIRVDLALILSDNSVIQIWLRIK